MEIAARIRRIGRDSIVNAYLVEDSGEITIVDGASPARPGGRRARTVAAGAGGVVTVTQNQNAAGTMIRTFTLPAVTEPLPFRLVLVK